MSAQDEPTTIQSSRRAAGAFSLVLPWDAVGMGVDDTGKPSMPSNGGSSDAFSCDASETSSCEIASSAPSTPGDTGVNGTIFDPPNNIICSADTLLQSLKNTCDESTISLYRNQLGSASQSDLRFGGVR